MLLKGTKKNKRKKSYSQSARDCSCKKLTKKALSLSRSCFLLPSVRFQKNRKWQNLISQALLYLKLPTLLTLAYPYKISELNSVLHSSRTLSKSFYLFDAFCLQWTVSPFLPAPQNTAFHQLWRLAFEKLLKVELIRPFCRYAIFQPTPHIIF